MLYPSYIFGAVNIVCFRPLLPLRVIIVTRSHLGQMRSWDRYDLDRVDHTDHTYQELLCRICIGQTQPMKHVEHADCMAPARQREVSVDHTDHTDHTDHQL